MDKFGIIILAAGSASRMGQPKQLLDFHGMPLIRHAVVEALAVGCHPVIVVCGAIVDPIRQALAGLAVEIAVNPQWEQGMGTSIQTGLRHLESFAVDGMILALADQPLVGRASYQKLLATQRETGSPIVSSHYADTVGVPVLFAPEYFPHLMALAPAQGCKGVIQAHRSHATLVDCPDATADIDTHDDYERVLAEFLHRQANPGA
ncbi:MAG: nucleotidyltransferase family protein [Acidobacteria bacterium]|nr:nucleotidyltransferase family protein [Acidobacteriota bacterium]